MSNLDQGDVVGLTEEQRQAQLAAMSRALNGTSSLAGTTGQSDIFSGGLGIGSSAGLGVTPAPGSQAATGSAPLSAAGQNALGVAPASSEVQSALGVAPSGTGTGTSDSMQRAAAQAAGTGGSLGTTLAGVSPVQINQSQLAAALNDARASDARQAAARSQTAIRAGTTSTVTQPKSTTVVQPVTTPTGTTTQGGTTDTGTTTPGTIDTRTSIPGNPFGTGTIASQGGFRAAGTDATAGAGTTDAGAAGAAGAAGPSGAGAGTTGVAGLGDLNSITSAIGALTASLTSPGAPVDAQYVYMKQAQSILSMLDQQEATMRADFEKSGTQMDPATQFNIGKLRETLETNLKGVKEQLNSRGLYDSGIELQLENNLQKGSASDEAQLLSTRFSKLQDQLNQGLQSISQNRFQASSQFGLAGANAQNNSDEDLLKRNAERENTAYTGMLNLRGQMSNAQTAANSLAGENSRAADSNASAMQRALLNEQGANARSAATVAEDQRQYNETFGMNKAKYNQDFAYNAQQDAMKRALSTSRGVLQPQTGPTPSQGQKNGQLTNAAAEAASQFPNMAAAQTSLDRNRAAFEAQGIDTSVVQQAINERFGTPLRKAGGSI